MRREISLPPEEELERIREELYAFCFPNIPGDLETQAAFEQAARLQYAWEENRSRERDDIPPWAESFQIGDFGMRLVPERQGGLTARTLCPAAYGLLLRHGLLYRGAEGRKDR